MVPQDTPAGLADALDLAALLRPAWDDISAAIPPWHPRNEGDPDPDPDPEPGPDPEPDPDPEPGPEDWKAQARKHERRAKQERKEREQLQARLAKIEEGNQSETEKALAKAREEAAAEARAEADKERRSDRLEVAVTRLASKGITLGEGDDAKTVKFADPEDALVFVERAIARGDLDTDDIFTEDGKVQTDAVTEALQDLLQRKPRLAADAVVRDGLGSSDAGRGSGSGGKDDEDMTADDHFKAVRRHK